MKKIKPLLLACAGLMGIATLFGAYDLATSNSAGQLTNLYVEKDTVDQKPDIRKQEKNLPLVIKEEKKEADEKVLEEKPINKQKKSVKKEISKNKSELIEEKELEWESFSRKPINRRFKKAANVIDTTKADNSSNKYEL